MAAVVAPLTFTVINAMTACGLNIDDATVMAMQIFMDDFKTCKDISNGDIDDALKTFSVLMVTQGQFRFFSAMKQRVKAFNQWSKDQFRLGIDPTTLAFLVNTATELLRCINTHKMFVDRSDAIALAAKTEKLTKDTKWEDWAPSFLKYLRAIPGRDGVPLKYIVRENDLPDKRPNVNFLDDYIMNAPLTGQVFTIDASEVHTFIVNFITQNEKAESIIKIFENEGNGIK